MAVTLEDIAKRAGVTQAAVSEIVRNHPNAQRFRPETRERVLKIARQLDYRPHFFASQIRAENRKLAMLCVASLNDFFAAQIAQAFESVLSNQTYNLLVSSLVNKQDSDFYSGILGPQGIMALALVGYSSKRHFPDARLKALIKQDVRVVTIGRDTEVEGVTQIVYNNAEAVEKALAHLLERVPKRIWLFGKNLSGEGRQIVDPLCRIGTGVAYLEKHAPETEMEVVNLQGYSEQAQQLISERLADQPTPDAIFCETDWLGWGTINALHEAGLQPGKDVAVVGFNDDLFSRYTQPGLTSVRIPCRDLGETAARTLIEIYEGRQKPGERILLPTELIIRGSSQA